MAEIHKNIYENIYLFILVFEYYTFFKELICFSKTL
jgi:hypothetical protein